MLQFVTWVHVAKSVPLAWVPLSRDAELGLTHRDRDRGRLDHSLCFLLADPQFLTAAMGTLGGVRRDVRLELHEPVTYLDDPAIQPELQISQIQDI